MAPTNTIVEGRIRTPGLEAAFQDATVVELDIRSRRQNASPSCPT